MISRWAEGGPDDGAGWLDSRACILIPLALVAARSRSTTWPSGPLLWFYLFACERSLSTFFQAAGCASLFFCLSVSLTLSSRFDRARRRNWKLQRARVAIPWPT